MIDLEVLESSYKILKEYIPSKDRNQAVQHLVDDLQEVLDEEQLKQLAGVDTYLREAIEDILGEDELADEFEDEEW
jgi:uncharacterized protein YqeY